MRALDTGVLLGLLEGSVKVRELLRRSRGAELATTEANLLELAVLCSRGPAKGRAARLAALDKLRQRLTVLPLDGRAYHAAAAGIRGGAELSWSTLGMLGALEAAGCEELLTDDPRYGRGGWSFRVKVLTI
ncbi:MAG TPA: PIN domain-containing protein [Thermoplasmata archaeon]|nr:PIN domain-containing protein [Thermoplasmata archaeon]